jgi:hypothetical protein
VRRLRRHYGLSRESWVVAWKWRGGAALSVVAVIRADYDVGVKLPFTPQPPAMHGLPLASWLSGHAVQQRAVCLHGTHTCMQPCSFPSRRSLGRGMQGPIYQSCGLGEY